jgi:hypothetical protein
MSRRFTRIAAIKTDNLSNIFISANPLLYGLFCCHGIEVIEGISEK